MPPFPESRLTRRRFLGGAVAAAALSILPRDSFAGEEPKLNFYNWDDYIGETTLADFKGRTGITVRLDLFVDNGELFARLKAGNPGYDVIVPTNDFLERMIAHDMLMPLDHAAIPNMANIEPAFRDAAFDPGRRHSVPYLWGTMGIGYRKSRCDGIPDSWRWLYQSDRYSGRGALLSDAGSVLGAAFKYLGHPLNTADPRIIKMAEDLIIAQKPHLKRFAPDTGQDLLLSGEVDIVMEWNGDILQAMEEDDDIAYVVPREGSAVWEDVLAIPRGAPHPGNAHAFMNFILEAHVGAAIADAVRYATPNAAAKALLPPSYREDPVIFPSEATLKTCEPGRYAGPETARLYDAAWTRIQAA
ncbi:MAG: spermidine/putrescine ABC transporter substrate-binding protein [Deltaproteobacteria bacterium]|nr:spermidine/putrescine ABC transporter substrate-binding protein [Deltaproteobacteria bacterium]